MDTVVKTQSKPPTRQANQSYGNPRQFCGGRHQRGNCSAYGKTCTQCNKRNLFATVCRGKQKSEVNEVVEEEPVNVGGFDLFVGTISANKLDAWYETLKVFNLSVKFKLDTGAQAKIIPNSLLKNTSPSPTISPTNVKLKTYKEDVH